MNLILTNIVRHIDLKVKRMWLKNLQAKWNYIVCVNATRYTTEHIDQSNQFWAGRGLVWSNQVMVKAKEGGSYFKLSQSLVFLDAYVGRRFTCDVFTTERFRYKPRASSSVSTVSLSNICTFMFDLNLNDILENSHCCQHVSALLSISALGDVLKKAAVKLHVHNQK